MKKITIRTHSGQLHEFETELPLHTIDQQTTYCFRTSCKHDFLIHGSKIDYIIVEEK